MKENILIVSPHPDDETLGCGGTIFRHVKEKHSVSWIIMTKMTPDKYPSKIINNRKSEIDKVAKKYSFKNVFNMDYKTSELENYKLSDIIDNLSKIINKIRPSTLYLPFPYDIHTDHKITFDSFNPFTKSFRYNLIKKIRIYETLSESEQSFFPSPKFNPNLFINVENFLMKKIDVMKIYKSELNNHPFPRSLDAIKFLAKYRGIQSNFKYADLSIAK